MTIQKLFSTPAGNDALSSAIEHLKLHESDVVHVRLRQVLNIIKKNAEHFDKACQINIEWIGGNAIDALKSLSAFNNEIDEALDDLTATIYRFIIEFDLSVQADLSMEFRAFTNVVNSEITRFSGRPLEQIEFARRDMAAAIVKKVINTEEFGSLRDITPTAARIEEKFNSWNAQLKETEKKAVLLSEALEKHTQAFNFVGLHRGFSDLAETIEGELEIAQKQMIGFGLLLIMPSFLELYFIWSKAIDLDNLSISLLIANSLAVLALTLIMLYFFRIALRKADSSRAQLIQVRLRMSLCRFIQSYADYSGEIKSKNGVALEKFETLIFSGIVSSDEKLPSTFDGIEQLASLAKSVRGGS